MPYDPTIYLGSAAHYRCGRPAYSLELEPVLTREIGLDGKGRLLDGGCGPGVLTVRLAHLFEDAVGLDPDAAMLAEGQRAAEEKGITNIRWVQSAAEDLPAVAPGPYRLVTLGQSFWWTDELRVAETVYDMLEPGGSMALIDHTVTRRPRPADPGVPAIPHDEINALVTKYLGATRRAGQGTVAERIHSFEDVLARTRFGVRRQFFVPGIPDLLRDSESVLSGYFSFSYSAPHLFGDRLDDSAEEVRALLAKRSAEGVFWDWPGDTEVISWSHASCSNIEVPAAMNWPPSGQATRTTGSDHVDGSSRRNPRSARADQMPSAHAPATSAGNACRTTVNPSAMNASIASSLSTRAESHAGHVPATEYHRGARNLDPEKL